MIVSVPYTYEVLGFEPRRTSNATTVLRQGVVDVEIEEIPEDAAPVAAVWTRARQRDLGEGVPIVIRSTARGLMAPADQSGDTPYRTEVPKLIPDLPALVALGSKGDGPFADVHRVPRGGMPPEPRLRTVLRDGEAECLQGIRDRAAALFMVAGVLHERCPDLVVKVDDVHHAGPLRGVEVAWATPDLLRTVDPLDLFRPDEWDVLKERVRSELGDVGLSEFDLPDELGWLDLRMPHAFRIETEAAAVSHAAAILFVEAGDAIEHAKDGAKARRGGRRGEERRAHGEWAAPWPIRMPDPRTIAAWGELGLLLSRGLDEGSFPILSDLVERLATDMDPDPPRGEDANWREEGVAKAWEGLRSALVRHGTRPDHVRHEDMEILSGLAP